MPRSMTTWRGRFAKTLEYRSRDAAQPGAGSDRPPAASGRTALSLVVMKLSWGAAIYIALLTGFVTGCATPAYVGRWAFEDADSYLGVAIERDGSCKVVGGSNRGTAGGFA